MLLNELENLLEKYKALSDKMSQLHDLGFDFYEGKFPLMSDMEFIFELTLKSHYTQQGADWVNWFVYETNYGERKLEAWDENKNLICQDLKSLHQYIEKHHKK
jgi:hypothetical protein